MVPSLSTKTFVYSLLTAMCATAEKPWGQPTVTSGGASCTAASSGADLNGSAAVDACRKIKARMMQVDAGRKLPWRELVNAA